MLKRAAIRVAFGTSSRSSSTRFGYYLRHRRAEARDVSARVSETDDDALSNRVADAGDDHWKCSGGILRRQRRGRPACQDHVHLELDQLGRKLWISGVAAVGGPVLDDEIFPFDVPQRPQPLPKALEVGGIDRRRRSFEHADAVEPVRRLCVDRDRRENEADTENDRESDQPHEHLARGWMRLPRMACATPEARRVFAFL